MRTRLVKNTISVALFLTVAFLLSAGSPVESEPSSKTQITGLVVDIETGEPIVGANIALINQYGGTVSQADGNFVLKNLRPGRYQLQISHIGYESKLIDSLDLSENETVKLTIELKKQPVSVKGVTVTPGQYSIMGSELTPRQVLSRDIIEARPQLSEDLFRAVQRLPGITYNDFSAKFNVRGGEQDEVLINLDGMEIYEPFHLKDVDGGLLSIIDVAAVKGVDLMVGGYPAVYGDRMSGVFNIKTKTPSSDHKRMSVGLSLLNARVMGEGTFGDGRGSWLVSGRRGYMDLMLKVVGDDDKLRPRYYDLFGKVRYRLNARHALTASFLKADDNLRYFGKQEETENNAGDTLQSSYGNTYFWLTLDSYLTARMVGKTIASIGTVKHEREGQVFDEFKNGLETKARDNRSSNLIGLKSDWEYEASNSLLLKGGFDIRHVSADYDYEGYSYDYVYNPGQIPPYQLSNTDSRLVAINPDGEKFSSYLSSRLLFTDFLTGEFGVRYDHTSYSSDDSWSPRANLVVSIADHTAVRFGWGYFHQVERIDEISVQDGETEFHASEKAEHFVVGVEHNPADGGNLRLNLFHKEYTDLQPAYRNTFGELVTFPELEEDRVKVRFNGKYARGVEIGIKKDVSEKISWWGSYSWSEVYDDIKSLYFYNEGVLVNYNKEFPFTYDQRHTVYFDIDCRFSRAWQLNMAWQFHSGWPYTEVFINLNPGPGGSYLESQDPWNATHDHFRRLDLRLSRKFFTSRGTLTAFVEVINVLSDKNIRNYEYHLVLNNGALAVERVEEMWFGILPSFGIKYDFQF